MRTIWEGKGTSYVFGAGNVHDLVKGPPAVVLPDGISLFETDMVVGGHQDADGVLLYATDQRELGKVGGGTR